MEENNLFNDRYHLERLLGRGNFSEVWLATDTKTNIQVALKIYAPATGLDDAGLDIFAREFALVVNANHRNLLKPLYYDSCDRKPFLVLPFCREGSLMRHVGKLSEQDAWRLLRDVASGLAWLHDMNPPIIHQDIKPDNIMIADNGDYVITDFGVSTHVKSTLRKSMSSAFSSAGTIAYMAPERFSADNTPIMANDIYSLGATVYEMLSGDTPFGDDGGLIQMKGAEVPRLPGEFSDQLKEVLARCLSTNPWERPTAEQLEKYAQTGLEGGKIVFKDQRQGFLRKNRWLVIASLAVAVVAIAILFFVSRGNDAEEAREEALRLEMATHNDDIQKQAKEMEAVGDQHYSIGEEHDEGFESAYINAFVAYRDATLLAESLQGDAVLENIAKLKDMMRKTEEKLLEAHESFIEKAVLFDDDPEVADEFRARAAEIAKVLGLETPAADNGQTADGQTAD